MSKVFREATWEGTHHSLPDGSQRVPQPPKEKVKVQMARRPVGARREEALKREEQRASAALVLGGTIRAGRPRTRPLPAPPRPVRPASTYQPKVRAPRYRNVSLFLAPIRSGRRGRPRRTGAVAAKPKAQVPKKPPTPVREGPVVPFSPVITLEFLKHDSPDGEEIGPDEPYRVSEEATTEAGELMEQEDVDVDENKEEDEELDPIDLQEQDQIEGIDELAEIEEFDEQSSVSIELEDLGELVEDLEDYERSERKQILANTIPYVPPRVIVRPDDPYGDASQSGYMTHLGAKRRPYVKKSDGTPKASKIKPAKTPKAKQAVPTTLEVKHDSEFASEVEHKFEMEPELELELELEQSEQEPQPNQEQEPEPETLLEKRKKEHYKHAYTTPYSNQPIEDILTLPPDRLKSIRVGYYDARSEKVWSLFLL